MGGGRGTGDEKVGTDPLMVLRHFITHEKDIVETEEYLIFDNIAYLKNSKTQFPIFVGSQFSKSLVKDKPKSSESGDEPKENPKEYYNIGSLKYFLDRCGISHPLYVRKVVQATGKRPWLQVVTRVDRQPLLDYLEGRLTKCEGIDPSGPIQFPLPAPKFVLDPSLAEGDESPISEYIPGGNARRRVYGVVVGPVGIGYSSDGSGNKGGLQLEVPPPPSVTIQQNQDAILASLISLKLPDTRNLFSSNPSGSVAKSLSELKIKHIPDVENTELSLKVKVEQNIENMDKNSIMKAMGPEKILELKAKRRAVKIHEVSAIPDVVFDQNSDPTIPVLAASKVGTLSFTHERPMSDRNSILRSNKKEFFKSVNAILGSLRIREERMKKFGPALRGRAGLSKTPISDSVAALPSYYRKQILETPPPVIKVEIDATKYSRYDQVAKLPLETDEFGINPLLSFSRGPGLKEGVKQAMAMDVKRKHSDVISKPNEPSSPSESKPPPAKKHRRDFTPIIIVPDGPPSLITILNAKDILQDLHFVPVEDKKGCRKMNELIIHHIKPNSGGKSVPYKVVSFPEKLPVSDWERVVGVFVTGKAWQFKGWPWNANPVEICTRLNAFNIRFDDIETEPHVKQWPVHVIAVNRHRRHLDKAAFAQFWSSVESFIAKNKPHLRY